MDRSKKGRCQTLYISRENRKYLVRNFWGVIFVALFAIIYEHFSHDVVSYYMLGAFLIPVAGSVPFMEMEAMKKGSNIGTLPRELWQLGVFTLTQGSIMKGIIEIYGTTNKWTIAYLPIAAVFIAASVATAYRDLHKQQDAYA